MTLVELMVTLAVAAILLTIAIPSFRSITLSNRLTTVANDYVDALHTARMEAIKRNSYAQFCSNVAANNGTDTLGLYCNSGSSVGGGPGAVVLQQASSTSPSTVPYLAHAPNTGVSTPLKLNGNILGVRFDGQGLAYVPGTTTLVSSTTPVVDLCTSAISYHNHRVITITTGTIISVTSTSGACP